MSLPGWTRVRTLDGGLGIRKDGHMYPTCRPPVGVERLGGEIAERDICGHASGREEGA
jgi:hypothetical protein